MKTKTSSKKSLKRVVRWLVLNMALVALTVIWLVYGQEMAGNLLRFYLGLNLFLMVIGSLTEETRNKCRKAGRSVPGWLTRLSDGAILVMLVGYGYTAWGIALFISMVAEAAMYGDHLEKGEDEAASAMQSADGETSGPA